MDKQEYINFMMDTVRYEFKDYELQNIINELRLNEIATYNKRKEQCVVIYSEDTKSDRICECIKSNPHTLYLIENFLVKKSYKYAIYYKTTSFQVESIKKKCINIEDFNNNISGIKDYSQVCYFENKEYIAFRFYKTINPFYNTIDSTKNILYPTLWVYHKGINILEYRFNRLTFKNDDNFYDTTLMPQLLFIEKHAHCGTTQYMTNNIMAYVVDYKENEVENISQSMGLREDSKASLKIGTTSVMPFIGELEELLKKNKQLFLKSPDIHNLLQDYLTDIKENSTYDSRLLYWKLKESGNPYVNILFSYKMKTNDLFNFQEPRKITMEVMNYVIRYIFSAEKELRESKNRQNDQVSKI